MSNVWYSFRIKLSLSQKHTRAKTDPRNITFRFILFVVYNIFQLIALVFRNSLLYLTAKYIQISLPFIFQLVLKVNQGKRRKIFIYTISRTLLTFQTQTGTHRMPTETCCNQANYLFKGTPSTHATDIAIIFKQPHAIKRHSFF